MYFASDNTGPAHPKVMEALLRANEGYMTPYGADPIMDEVRTQIRQVFEAPEAEVYLVATGSAANCLGLATLTQPWQTIFCTPLAHIHQDECNAPEFYTGGAKLTLVGDLAGDGDRMTPQTLEAAILGEEIRGIHGPARGPVALTNVTERGHVYRVSEIAALADVAKSYGLPVHLDGARFANAIVASNATPAEMTWRAGVDILSFGGTKNGLLGVEAVVLFDPAKAQEFEYRRKRGGHLFSKNRFLSAQMQAYLTDDLWRETAAQANANAARLADGLRKAGGEMRAEPQANMIFCALPRALHQRAFAAGAQYHLWSGELEGPNPDEMLEARLVCDWSIPEAEIDRFVELLAQPG